MYTFNFYIMFFFLNQFSDAGYAPPLSPTQGVAAIFVCFLSTDIIHRWRCKNLKIVIGEKPFGANLGIALCVGYVLNYVNGFM